MGEGLINLLDKFSSKETKTMLALVGVLVLAACNNTTNQDFQPGVAEKGTAPIATDLNTAIDKLCSAAIQKSSFVTTKHENGSEMAPLDPMTQEKIKDNLTQTCIELIHLGYDKDQLVNVISVLNIAVITNPERYNYAMFNRLEILFNDPTATRHEFLHQLFNLDSNIINASVLREAIAYRNEASVFSTLIGDPRLHNGNFVLPFFNVPFALRNRTYADAATSLDAVDTILRKKARYKDVKQLDLLLLDAYRNSAQEMLNDGVLWGDPMPDKDLFAYIADEMGDLTSEDVKNAFLSQPLFRKYNLATASKPTPDPTQIIPKRGSTPTPAQQKAK